MAGRMTDLQAVNQMLAAVNIRQVASVSSETGSDDASDALRVLYRTSTEVQARGWPANTTEGKLFTSHSSNGTLDITDSAAITPLRIHCVAPGEFRDALEIRGDLAYNKRTGTTNLGNSQAIYLDYVEELDFEDDCPPDLQAVIVAEAIANFKAEREGQGAFQNRIANREAKAEVTANRDRGMMGKVSQNNSPLIPGGGSDRG